MMDINNDPQGGNHHATWTVSAIDCGNGRGVSGGTTTMTTMRKQPLMLALMVVVTMAVMHRPLPKRRRIARPSRKLCRKSLDNSAEGEDRQRHHNNNRRTGRGWGGSDKDDEEEEYDSCWKVVG